MTLSHLPPTWLLRLSLSLSLYFRPRLTRSRPACHTVSVTFAPYQETSRKAPRPGGEVRQNTKKGGFTSRRLPKKKGEHVSDKHTRILADEVPPPENPAPRENKPNLSTPRLWSHVREKIEKSPHNVTESGGRNPGSWKKKREGKKINGSTLNKTPDQPPTRHKSAVSFSLLSAPLFASGKNGEGEEGERRGGFVYV